ncbi:MAG: hypothetical protein ACE5NW_06675 [Acidiferrobacterales bacterium]
MALFTEAAVGAAMGVIAAMATDAAGRQTDFLLYGSLMAPVTVQACVRTVEMKSCSLVVIKIPRAPVSSVVALFASRT